MEQLRGPFRVVLYRDGNDWVARCLEFDLMGDGDTKQQALERFAEAVSLQVEATVEHSNPDNLFSPAEGRYFRMFAAGEGVSVDQLHIEVGPVVVDVQAREYAGPTAGFSRV